MLPVLLIILSFIVYFFLPFFAPFHVIMRCLAAFLLTLLLLNVELGFQELRNAALVETVLLVRRHLAAMRDRDCC